MNGVDPAAARDAMAASDGAVTEPVEAPDDTDPFLKWVGTPHDTTTTTVDAGPDSDR